MARSIYFVATTLARWFTRERRDERGQVLVLFVLLIPVLLGMTALALDLGGYAAHRRSNQNAADAIALAAAQELPSESAATSAALEWADDYGFEPGEVSVSVRPVTEANPNPSIRVEIVQNHKFPFMKALGVGDADVEAAATAIKTSPGGLVDVVPWAVLASARDEAEPGETMTLKYDSSGVENGNFAAIRLDGSGASVYEDSVLGGSDSVICSSEAVSCSETSPICDGAVCQTETGNMVGGTRDGVDYRLDNTDAHCDELGEVFAEVDGEYRLQIECNPWVDGSYRSLRVIILPVIESLCAGSCDVTVTEFAVFWLEGYGDERCTGSACEIEGQFITADVSLASLIGQFDPNGGIHYVRLVE